MSPESWMLTISGSLPRLQEKQLSTEISGWMDGVTFRYTFILIKNKPYNLTSLTALSKVIKNLICPKWQIMCNIMYKLSFREICISN
jgi:hypothetical protein